MSMKKKLLSAAVALFVAASVPLSAARALEQQQAQDTPEQVKTSQSEASSTDQDGAKKGEPIAITDTTKKADGDSDQPADTTKDTATDQKATDNQSADTSSSKDATSDDNPQNAGIAIDETNFPDANFRAWIKANIPGASSGYLTPSAIAATIEINVTNQNISDLTGVSYFGSLQRLICGSNTFTSFPKLPPSLHFLYAHDGKLTSVNIDAPNLIYLDVAANDLDTLDQVPTSLTTLDVSHNHFTYIDISKLPKLGLFKGTDQTKNITLEDDGPGTYSAKVTLSNPIFNQTAVSYAHGLLQSSDSTVSSTLFTSESGVPGRDLSGNLTLTYHVDEGIPVDKEHFPDDTFRNWIIANVPGAQDKKLTRQEIAAETSMDLSGQKISDLIGIGYFTSLTDLNISNIGLKQLPDLPASITDLDMSHNEFSDLPKLPDGITTLNVSANHLTKADLSGYKALTSIEAKDQTPSLDVTGNMHEGYTDKTDLNKPTFAEKAITYDGTMLKSTNNKVASTEFSAQTGLSDKTLSGTLALAYKETPTPAGVPIDKTTFPDDTFRDWVIANIPGADDKILTDDEIKAVTSMDVSGQHISDLTGIGYFTSLTDLNISNTGLSKLSDLPASITDLNMSHNEFSNLPKLPAGITMLDVSANHLTKADLSGYKALTSVETKDQTSFFKFLGNMHDGYAVAADFDTPTFGEAAITYDKGMLKSSDNTVASTTFTAQTGLSGTTLSGNLDLSYTDSPTPAGIPIDKTTFPNDTFRDWVINNIPGADDKILTNDEIKAVTSMDLSGQHISDLTGIGYFTSLTNLNISNIGLKQLPDLPASITNLNMSHNEFADLPKLPAGITMLDVSANHLTKADLSGYKNLTTLNAKDQTPSLDVTGNMHEGYTDKTDLNKPTFAEKAITYDGTMLKSTNNKVASTEFSAQTGLSDKTLSGTLALAYKETPTPAGVPIDKTTFPDDTFRTWIINNIPGADDKILTNDEIKAVTSMDLSGQKISDLTGIGYFTSLTDLNISNIGLKQLPDLPASITNLNMSHNEFSNLPKLPAGITTLDVSANHLTKADLSSYKALATFAGKDQTTTTELTGSAHDGFTAQLDLNKPTFDASAVSYANGTLKSTDWNLADVNFSVQTGHADSTLSGKMSLTYSFDTPPTPNIPLGPAQKIPDTPQGGGGTDNNKGALVNPLAQTGDTMALPLAIAGVVLAGLAGVTAAAISHKRRIGGGKKK